LWCLTISCNTILYSEQRANSNEGTALNINLLWTHSVYNVFITIHNYSYYNRTWPILNARLPWRLDNLWHAEFHLHFVTKQLHSLPLTKNPPWKSVSCNVKSRGLSSN
jgi:hypothetical protein